MNELVKALVAQLGVTDDQAAKGSGLLFKAAKERLGGDFSKIEQALPGISRLIQAAPSASASASGGGLGAMLGGLASALGGGRVMFPLDLSGCTGLDDTSRWTLSINGTPASSRRLRVSGEGIAIVPVGFCISFR